MVVAKNLAVVVEHAGITRITHSLRGLYDHLKATFHKGNGGTHNGLQNSVAPYIEDASLPQNGTQHGVPQISPTLQAILDDPAWELVDTTNQRERLLIGSLGRLGYRSISAFCNQRYNHTIYRYGNCIATLNFRNNTYASLKESVPDDMKMVLEKAGFSPEKEYMVKN